MKKKMIVFSSLPVTLFITFLIPNSLILPLFLIPFWYLVFKPIKRSELIVFIIASLFIIGQNYSVLRSGGFAFTKKDFFLMPYYEPFMWGFWYLNIKRFISEKDHDKRPVLGVKAVVGLAVTALCFNFFAHSSTLLLVSTLCSTGLLLLFFHTSYDLSYGLYALFIGFIVELFGVHTGQWTYPDPDFLGMPYWFATMWISVGILGRRLLIPLAEWIDARLP